MTVSTPVRGPAAEAAEGVSPLLVNVLLGVWLFVSAFLWPGSQAQATNAWICGVLCVALAIAAMGLPWARYLSAALAIWLFVSAWALLVQPVAALWNDVLCAIAIFVVSLVPATTPSPSGGGPRVARST